MPFFSPSGGYAPVRASSEPASPLASPDSPGESPTSAAVELVSPPVSPPADLEAAVQGDASAPAPATVRAEANAPPCAADGVATAASLTVVAGTALAVAANALGARLLGHPINHASVALGGAMTSIPAALLMWLGVYGLTAPNIRSIDARFFAGVLSVVTPLAFTSTAGVLGEFFLDNNDVSSGQALGSGVAGGAVEATLLACLACCCYAAAHSEDHDSPAP